MEKDQRPTGLAFAKKSTSKRQGPPRRESGRGRGRRNPNSQPLGQGQADKDKADLIREKTRKEQRQVLGDIVTNNPVNDSDQEDVESEPELIPDVRRSGRKRKERVSESSIDEPAVRPPNKRNATKKNANRRRKMKVYSSSSEESGSGEVDSISKNKTGQNYQSQSELMEKYGGYYSDSEVDNSKDNAIITIGDTDSETEDVIDLLKEIPRDSSTSPSTPSPTVEEGDNYESQHDLNYQDNLNEKEDATTLSSSQEMVPLNLSILLNPIDMSSYLWEIEDVLSYFAIAAPQQKDKTKSRDFCAGKNIGLDSKWRILLKRTREINKGTSNELDEFTLSIALLELKAEGNPKQKKICAKISTSFVNEKGQFYRSSDFPIQLVEDKNGDKDMTTALWRKENIYEKNVPQKIIPSFKIKDKYLLPNDPLKLNIYIMVYIYGGEIPQIPQFQNS